MAAAALVATSCLPRQRRRSFVAVQGGLNLKSAPDSPLLWGAGGPRLGSTNSLPTLALASKGKRHENHENNHSSTTVTVISPHIL